MKLTSDNYYSLEADREYMSCSQYQDFLECEAATMAKMYGLFTPKQSEALLVGNYFHTALESDEAHEAFCNEYESEIFKLTVNKRTGEVERVGKYEPYVKADKMINAAMSDPLIKKLILMPGECEKINDWYSLWDEVEGKA